MRFGRDASSHVRVRAREGRVKRENGRRVKERNTNSAVVGFSSVSVSHSERGVERQSDARAIRLHKSVTVKGVADLSVCVYCTVLAAGSLLHRYTRQARAERSTPLCAHACTISTRNARAHKRSLVASHFPTHSTHSCSNGTRGPGPVASPLCDAPAPKSPPPPRRATRPHFGCVRAPRLARSLTAAPGRAAPPRLRSRAARRALCSWRRRRRAAAGGCCRHA